jgi:phospholipid N-methyltransferase
MHNQIVVPVRAGKTPPRRSMSEHPRATGSSVRGRLQFLGAFLCEPLQVGAFWPSSAELASLVVDGCDLASREMVVELGPGSGAFTGLVLEGLRSHSRFLALEINAINVRELRRRFPRLQVREACAERLPEYLRREQGRKADCIISGLAWGNMLPATQDRIFDAVLASLAPGGLFTTFAYVHATWFPTSLRFRRKLFRHFARIETTPIVWRNLPPAFVYRCWRAA